MRIIETTARNWWPEASWTGDNELPGVLRAAGVERTPRQKAGTGNAGEHRCNGWCACEGRCAGGCGRKAEGAMNGEVLEVPDLTTNMEKQCG